MEQKDNQGVAFYNTYKNKESQPDFTGTAMVNGKPQSVGVWFSKSKKEGKLYLYMKYTEKVEGNSESDTQMPY